MKLKQVIYCSELSSGYETSEVYKILQKSRKKNASISVTGYLVYGSRYFMQVIEGPEVSIKGLYDKISADSRHENIKLIQETEVKTLSYSKWSMGFANLTEKLHPNLEKMLDDYGLLGDFNPYVLDAKMGLKIMNLFSLNSELLKH